MFGMESHLLGGSSSGSTLEYVERTFFFAQVVEGFSVGSPYRFAVLTTESRLFLISRCLSGSVHPDVAGDRGDLVLAPVVFISLLVLIEHMSLFVDGDAFHRHGREHDGTSACHGYFVNLLELSGRKSCIFGGRSDVGSKQDVLAVFVGNGLFVARVGGQPLRNAAVFGYGENIQASHTVGCKGDLLAVGAPYGVGVEGGIGRDLCCSPACGRHRVDVSFVGESNGSPVRRENAVTHP